MKLGTYLLRDAVIGLNELEAGLRAQVLYGGRLGTNLIELGFIDVDTLGTYLGKMLSVPVATVDAFESIEPSVLETFGPELAELYSAVPLGPDQADETALSVALIDPTDRDGIAALARQCSRAIVPCVAAELRMLYYLEKHFSVKRRVRFFRTSSPPPSQGQSERRRHPSHSQSPVRFEPRRRKTAASQPPSNLRPVLDFDTAVQSIEEATHRDQIAESLLDFAIGRFEASVLFLVRYGNAMGWRAYSRGSTGVAAKLDQLSLPLDAASVLQTAKDSTEVFRGSAQTAGRKIEERIWKTLGTEEPSEMMIVPVCIGERVVNLLYVHAKADESLDESACRALADLATSASTAYTALIRRARDSR